MVADSVYWPWELIQSIQSDRKQLMSSTTSATPQEPCVRCDTLDSVFVSLDCQHHFCLVCMSYLFIKCRAHGANSDRVQCSLCNRYTQLDAPSVEAIRATIEGTLLPNLNSFQLDSQAPTQAQRTNDPATQAKHPSQKLSKRQSDGTTLQDQDNTRHFCCESPHRSALTQGLCTIHAFEQLGFVCYTCDNYELCSKCVSSRHKTHQVRSLRQAMELEAEEITDRKLDNDENIQFVESRERRLEDQRQAAHNKWARVKDQIAEAFGQLRIKIRQREAELIDICDEHYRTIEHTLEKQLGRLQSQLIFLRNFKDEFKNLLSYDPKTCRADSAVDYFSLCQKLKKKLCDSSSRIDQSLKHPLTTTSIQLDQRDLLPILESIQSINLTELQLPTQTQPSRNDKYSSLNTSRERTRRMEDSSGFMTKRRTEMLETFEKISNKKGLDKNFPNYVSKFLDRQVGVAGNKKEESLLGHKIQSTKALSKTGGFEPMARGKAKKQMNLTKEGIEYRTVTEVSSPVFRLNYKTGVFERKKG